MHMQGCCTVLQWCLFQVMVQLHTPVVTLVMLLLSRPCSQALEATQSCCK
jgi:hypothetical protein